MRLAFLAALGAVALTFFTLWRIELASKEASAELRRLRRRLEADPSDGNAVPAAAAPTGKFAEVM